jgi:hypothetical protein
MDYDEDYIFGEIIDFIAVTSVIYMYYNLIRVKM